MPDMPGFTEWLQTLTDDELRQFITRVVPAMDKAAHAEFGARLRRPSVPKHGTGCPPGCCGAGVRQWR